MHATEQAGASDTRLAKYLRGKNIIFILLVYILLCSALVNVLKVGNGNYEIPLLSKHKR